MTKLSYSFRSHPFRRQRTFRIGTDALYWTDGKKERSIAYADVDEVRFSGQLMRGAAALTKRKMWCCHLNCRSARGINLSPLHCVRIGSWEDRSTPYVAF